ncbi:two-component system OmpR family response regulator [Brevibacterium sanguinis]|uniref:Two-component system OmpR family response regulator n=2 Tax=Brevibacterium TaxID=1696 RepID=A0A366IEE3_9MICO|nr:MULTISPECIES: response regulator transcription factor [Brevibacterium]RBP62362.1 two-component system OmpR family response regulator [Brevibacterium sanguinis]RBP68751.1 two-component system OmpR family response regulator [Brevibacterium celere]
MDNRDMDGTAQTTAPRILIVDDEKNLAELLVMACQVRGWSAEGVGTGRAAVARARAKRFDAIVLDVMLPDLDGFGVIEKLRGEGIETPVVFLSARDEVDDRLTGLRLGGDDYVTKPFNLDEVVARIEARLRRRTVGPEAEDDVLRVGDLELNESTHEVARSGRPIELTAREYEVLLLFMRNPRVVLSKSQILDRVWDYDFGGNGNIVELYVSYLRKKIDAPFPDLPPLFHTKRGAGYSIRADR